jgi:hypothetical protein
MVLNKREELHLMKAIIHDDIIYVEKILSRVKKDSIHIHISEYGLLYDKRHTLLDLCIHYNKLSIIKLLVKYGYDVSNIEHLNITEFCPYQYPYHQRNIVEGIPSLIWCIYYYQNKEIAEYLEKITDVTTTYKYAYYAMMLNDVDIMFKPLLESILLKCKKEDIEKGTYKIQTKDYSEYKIEDDTLKKGYWNSNVNCRIYKEENDKKCIDSEPVIKELKQHIYYGNIKKIKQLLHSKEYRKLSQTKSYHTLFNDAAYSYPITKLLFQHTKENLNYFNIHTIRHPIVDAFGHGKKKVIELFIHKSLFDDNSSMHLLPLIELLKENRLQDNSNKNQYHEWIRDIFDNLDKHRYQRIIELTTPNYYPLIEVDTSLLRPITHDEFKNLVEYIKKGEINDIYKLSSTININSISIDEMHPMIGSFHLLQMVKDNLEMVKLLFECGCKSHHFYEFDRFFGNEPIMYYLHKGMYDFIHLYLLYTNLNSLYIEHVKEIIKIYLIERTGKKHIILNNVLRRCNQNTVDTARHHYIQEGRITHFFSFYSHTDIILTKEDLFLEN